MPNSLSGVSIVLFTRNVIAAVSDVVAVVVADDDDDDDDDGRDDDAGDPSPPRCQKEQNFSQPKFGRTCH